MVPAQPSTDSGLRPGPVVNGPTGEDQLAESLLLEDIGHTSRCPQVNIAGIMLAVPGPKSRTTGPEFGIDHPIARSDGVSLV